MYDCTVGSFVIFFHAISVADFTNLNLAILSDMVLSGFPCLEIKLCNAIRNSSAVRSPTISKCIALTMRQVNKLTQTFLFSSLLRLT